MKTLTSAHLSEQLMRYSSLFSMTRNIGIAMTTLKKRATLDRVSNPGFFVNKEQLLKEIQEQGFSNLFSLSHKQLKDIRRHCESASFYAIDTKNEYGIDINNPTKPSESILYHNDQVYKKCDTIRNLAHDDQLLFIAKNYLGSEPKIKDVRTWWSFPPKETGYLHQYGFHYDIDAFKFLKFFIYLTDVDEDCGPHSIISHTHKTKTWQQKRNRRLTDEQVAEMFEPDRVNVMLGKAGQGFFEDTFAYHKGTTPKKPRLILQVEYSL